MAMKIHNGTADAMLSAFATRCNNGYLRIYAVGAGVPATANTAIGAQPVLADLRFPATAFPTGPVAGTGTNRKIDAGTMVSDSGADATGTASFFRVFTSSGTASDANVVYQGACGGTSSGAELELNSTSIVQDGVVSISSLTIIMPTE